MEAQDIKNKAKLAALIAADKEEAEKQKAHSLALESIENAKQKELDKEMHAQEKAELEAKKAVEKEALQYAVALKGAENASELDKMKMQLEAAKAKAEMDKKVIAASEAEAKNAIATGLAEQAKIASELRAQTAQT
jgi:hypothetical protein